jgi:hypothetical protein
VSAHQGWLQSEPSALQEEGVIPSPVASDPTLRKLRRIQPAGDRPGIDACLLRDLQLGLTLTVQCMHLHVSLVPRLPASLPPRFNQRQSSLCAFRGLGFSQLLSNIYLQLLNITLHGLAQIGNQMITISDLNGRGRALSAAICVQGRSITRDHLDPWMHLQPFCKAVRGPHRKQIDHLLLLQVHQHRPVALLLTPSPIINAQHSHWRLAYAATSLFDSP